MTVAAIPIKDENQGISVEFKGQLEAILASAQVESDKPLVPASVTGTRVVFAYNRGRVRIYAVDLAQGIPKSVEGGLLPGKIDFQRNLRDLYGTIEKYLLELQFEFSRLPDVVGSNQHVICYEMEKDDEDLHGLDTHFDAFRAIYELRNKLEPKSQ